MALTTRCPWLHEPSIYAYLEDTLYLKDLDNQKSVKSSIIITARYRTGSTYLYSLFANLTNVAAFNEPLHRDITGWLNKDDLSSQKFKYKVSHTQTFKGNYFAEYKSLDRELFLKYYRSEFGITNIVMSSLDKYDELKDYVTFLLSSHPAKLKVLQFNRINFR